MFDERSKGEATTFVTAYFERPMYFRDLIQQPLEFVGRLFTFDNETYFGAYRLIIELGGGNIFWTNVYVENDNNKISYLVVSKSNTNSRIRSHFVGCQTISGFVGNRIYQRPLLPFFL